MVDREPEYDYRCPVCNRGYYAEVGMSLCPYCPNEKLLEYYRNKREEEGKAIARRRAYFRSEEFRLIQDEEAQFCDEDDRPY